MSTLQKRREKIVHDHMDAENRKDSEATLATFQRPRYEVIPTGEVYSGASSVKAFLRESMTAFPNFKFKDRRLHHASGVVVVEVTFEGTHEGFWRGLPPTGRSVSYRMCNIFVFDEDRLVCERLYFDLTTILFQLGIGYKPDSLKGRLSILMNHPFAFIGALFRLMKAKK